MLVDISKESNASDKYVIERIKNVGCPIILVMNKIDTKSKVELIPIINHYASLGIFADIIPISALKEINTEALVNAMLASSFFLLTVLNAIISFTSFTKALITAMPEKLS